MPKKPSAANVKFGAALKQALVEVGLTDTAQIGQMVAASQLAPCRKKLPYHAGVVEAWFSGTYIPTPPAFDAMLGLLINSPNAVAQLENLYFHTDQLTNDTELTVTVRAKKNRACLAPSDVIDFMASDGVHDGQPIAKSTLSEKWNGNIPFHDEELHSLDRLFTCEPSLISLRTDERASAFQADWQKAHAMDDFGDLLRACRHYLAKSQHDMANALSMRLGLEEPLSHTTICIWETNEHLPHRSLFKGTDVVTVYAALMQEAQATRPQLDEPAWTADHEKTLRAVLLQRLDRIGRVNTLNAILSGTATSPSPCSRTA